MCSPCALSFKGLLAKSSHVIVLVDPPNVRTTGEMSAMLLVHRSKWVSPVKFARGEIPVIAL